MVQCQKKKLFRDRTKAMLFRPGTVPIPIPVLSLHIAIITLLCCNGCISHFFLHSVGIVVTGLLFAFLCLFYIMKRNEKMILKLAAVHIKLGSTV